MGSRFLVLTDWLFSLLFICLRLVVKGVPGPTSIQRHSDVRVSGGIAPRILYLGAR